VFHLGERSSSSENCLPLTSRILFIASLATVTLLGDVLSSEGEVFFPHTFFFFFFFFFGVTGV
jgi:hypothetical protein